MFTEQEAPHTLENIVAFGARTQQLTMLYLHAKDAVTLSSNRHEQLLLMENTFKLLHNEKNLQKKAEITKGLLLVIKHQISKERFSTDSQLESMVDIFLDVETELGGKKLKDDAFDAAECTKAFQEFSAQNFDSKSGMEPTQKMQKKITAAVSDKTWNFKFSFNLMHKEMSKIKKSLSPLKGKKISPAQNKTLSMPKENYSKQKDKYNIMSEVPVSYTFNQESVLTFSYDKHFHERQARGEFTKITDTVKIDYNSDYTEDLKRYTQELEKALPGPSDDLLLQLKKMEIELDRIRYLIKIAEHCALYGGPKVSKEELDTVKKSLLAKGVQDSDIEQELKTYVLKQHAKNQQALKKYVLEQRAQFEALNAVSERAIKVLNSKLESKATTEAASNNTFGFLLRNLFNKDKTEREHIKNTLSEFQVALPKPIGLSTLPNQATETATSEVGGKVAEVILEHAKKDYNNIIKKMSTENIPFNALMGTIPTLINDINRNEPTTPLRKINAQIEALDYLAKIAQLKVMAPRTSIISISSSQAAELRELFSGQEMKEAEKKLREAVRQHHSASPR